MSILDKFKLDGKVAIVTGASKGLGQGMAVGLAEAGADLAVVARHDLAETAALVERLGRKCLQIHADMGDRKSVATIVEKTMVAYGKIDILVNNAGTIRRAEFLDFTEDDWDAVIKVNLDSVFFLSQAVAKVMVKRGQGGKIINTASMLSFQGGIRIPSYTAAKSGVMGLTRIMANELAKHNINVNAIAPGYMSTELTSALQNDPVRNKAIVDRIPAGHWGSAEDMKGAVVFLASEASSYVQGYTIAVDGGWLSR
jgi:2-dehydro-3-deoxy-D-gluconate 5-dehydrogenase